MSKMPLEMRRRLISEPDTSVVLNSALAPVVKEIDLNGVDVENILEALFGLLAFATLQEVGEEEARSAFKRGSLLCLSDGTFISASFDFNAFHFVCAEEMSESTARAMFKALQDVGILEPLYTVVQDTTNTLELTEDTSSAFPVMRIDNLQVLSMVPREDRVGIHPLVQKTLNDFLLNFE